MNRCAEVYIIRGRIGGRPSEETPRRRDKKNAIERRGPIYKKPPYAARRNNRSNYPLFVIPASFKFPPLLEGLYGSNWASPLFQFRNRLNCRYAARLLMRLRYGLVNLGIFAMC